MYFFFFMSGSRHFDAFSYMAHLQFNNGGCLTHYESSINIQIYIYCLCESCFPLLFSTRSTFEHIFSRSYRVGSSFFFSLTHSDAHPALSVVEELCGQVDRHGEDNRGVVLGCDAVQGLEITELKCTGKKNVLKIRIIRLKTRFVFHPGWTCESNDRNPLIF